MISDPQGEAMALCSLGNVYFAINEYNAANSYYENAFKISQSIADNLTEATALFNLAKSHQILGNFKTAITYCNQAIAIGTELSFTQLKDYQKLRTKLQFSLFLKSLNRKY